VNPATASVSPDGKYFVYYVWKHSDVLRNWTAISKPPYWTAVALWPHGQWALHGGGKFLSNKKVEIVRNGSWVTAGSDPEPLKLPPRSVRVIDIHNRYTSPPSYSDGEVEIPGILGAQWIKRDQQGRGIFARGGQLFAIQMSQHIGKCGETLLDDFSNDVFSMVEAPLSAKKW